MSDKNSPNSNLIGGKDVFILTVETVECFYILVLLIYSFIFNSTYSHISITLIHFHHKYIQNDFNEITPQHICQHTTNRHCVLLIKLLNGILNRNHFLKKSFFLVASSTAASKHSNDVRIPNQRNKKILWLKTKPTTTKIENRYLATIFL